MSLPPPRANPFGDLDDFAPQEASKPVPAAAIEELSEANGFPSRKAVPRMVAAPTQGAPSPTPPEVAVATSLAPPRVPRRRTTGRNQQINIKATEATITTLYRLADDLDLPLGAVLERALAALEGKS